MQLVSLLHSGFDVIKILFFTDAVLNNLMKIETKLLGTISLIDTVTDILAY